MMGHFSFKEKIILEDSRALLTPLKEAHIEQLLPIAEKYPNLLRYSPSEFGLKKHLVNYVSTAIAAREQELRYPFVIFDKEERVFAGSTSFGNIANPHKRLEIGWTWIAEDLQRSGLNRHCKFLMLSYAFDRLEFKRVEFRIDSRNAKSRAAVEAIGGTFEGELRSHTTMPDGFRRNTVCYSILKEEWDVLRSERFKRQA